MSPALHELSAPALIENLPWASCEIAVTVWSDVPVSLAAALSFICAISARSDADDSESYTLVTAFHVMYAANVRPNAVCSEQSSVASSLRMP